MYIYITQDGVLLPSLPPTFLLLLCAWWCLQMREQQLLELDALCRSKGVKLLVVRSYGLMGYMRVSKGRGGTEEGRGEGTDRRVLWVWVSVCVWVRRRQGAGTKHRKAGSKREGGRDGERDRRRHVWWLWLWMGRRRAKTKHHGTAGCHRRCMCMCVAAAVFRAEMMCWAGSLLHCMALSSLPGCRPAVDICPCAASKDPHKVHSVACCGFLLRFHRASPVHFGPYIPRTCS